MKTFFITSAAILLADIKRSVYCRCVKLSCQGRGLTRLELKCFQVTFSILWDAFSVSYNSGNVSKWLWKTRIVQEKRRSLWNDRVCAFKDNRRKTKNSLGTVVWNMSDKLYEKQTAIHETLPLKIPHVLSLFVYRRRAEEDAWDWILSNDLGEAQVSGYKRYRADWALSLTQKL